jgi:hypothetical protein
MNVFLKGGAEFSDNSFELVRRRCSEKLGAEVPNRSLCVARHFRSVSYEGSGRAYSKSSIPNWRSFIFKMAEWLPLISDFLRSRFNLNIQR